MHLQHKKNSLYNNTFPVLSQITSLGGLGEFPPWKIPPMSRITSLGYAIAGENHKALDLQKKFADDVGRIFNSIAVAGHIKVGAHYALGENAAGDAAMKAASRSTGVVVGGVGGFVAGGPVGSVAGGIAGGAAMDSIITGSEEHSKKDTAQLYGYIAAGKDIVDAVQQNRKITLKQGFDYAMMPVSDGIAGYTAGRTIGKPLGLDVAKGKTVPLPPSQSVMSELGGGEGSDKKELENRASQFNPNNVKSVSGRPSGYEDEADTTNSSNYAKFTVR